MANPCDLWKRDFFFKTNGLQPNSYGLHHSSDGLQPSGFLLLVVQLCSFFRIKDEEPEFDGRQFGGFFFPENRKECWTADMEERIFKT